MLRFLSSLFASTEQRSVGPDEALIDAAIERAVDGTDRRLRALGNYRKHLRDPVEHAVVHVMNLIDSFPDPAEMSKRAFSTDSRLRAFFVSTSHLREVISGFQTVHSYLKDRGGSPPEAIFGLLSMEWEERTVFGMELEGEMIRRDVKQVAVNFFNHRYLGPKGTEADTRWELKERAFDFLVQSALARIATAKSKRVELGSQRELLRRKLDTMKAGNWGLQPMLEATEGPPPDLHALETEIASVEAALQQYGTDAVSLERSLEYVVDTLGRCAEWLLSRELSLRLDHRGIKVTESSSTRSHQLELTELFSCDGERRVVLLGRIPRGELPQRPDFFEQARRYLG